MATTMEQYEAEVAPLKRQLFSAAVAPNADILELGMGTGPNLQYYAGQQVNNVYSSLYACGKSGRLAAPSLRMLMPCIESGAGDTYRGATTHAAYTASQKHLMLHVCSMLLNAI